MFVWFYRHISHFTSAVFLMRNQQSILTISNMAPITFVDNYFIFLLLIFIFWYNSKVFSIFISIPNQTFCSWTNIFIYSVINSTMVLHSNHILLFFYPWTIDISHPIPIIFIFSIDVIRYLPIFHYLPHVTCIHIFFWNISSNFYTSIRTKCCSNCKSFSSKDTQSRTINTTFLYFHSFG